MPELTLFLIRIGFLALLWLFVLVTVRVIRNDLFGPPRLAPPAASRAAAPVRQAPAKPPRPARRRKAPRRAHGHRGHPAG